MNVLVAGGAGFAGAGLAIHLKERGHRVVVMDSLTRRGTELNLPAFRRRSIPFVHGDVRHADSFAALADDVDVICHVAAQASAVHGYANPRFDIETNAVGL